MLSVQRIFVVFHSVFLTIQIVEVEDVIVDVDVFAIFIKINGHALAIFLSLFFRNNLSRGRTKKSRASVSRSIGKVYKCLRFLSGGNYKTRTCDPLLVRQVL